MTTTLFIQLLVLVLIAAVATGLATYYALVAFAKKATEMQLQMVSAMADALDDEFDNDELETKESILDYSKTNQV